MAMSILPKLRVLHYLLSESDDVFVAHCLDLDIVASGPDENEAVRRLNLLVKSQIEMALNTGNFQSLVFTAPKEYWDKFIRVPIRNISKLQIEVLRPQVLPADEDESALGVIAAHLVAAAVQQGVHAVR